MQDLQIWLALALLIGTPLVVIWSQHRENRKLRTTIVQLRAEVERLQGYEPQPDAPHLRDVRPLDGAGEALAKPPTDLNITLSELRRLAPSKRYRYPIGWRVVKGAPSLAMGWLVGDTNHILLTGQSDSGKDNWAFVTLLGLAAHHPPEQLQICIIDGKGLDFEGWRAKQHTWRLAADLDEIKPAMEALRAERQRRVGILREAGVAKWDEYPHADLPLLVVYVSELALLQSATSGRELENWLDTELTSARAFGIRYIISAQTVSNLSTRWRSQISVFVAGFQPRTDQDEPNTAQTTKQIKERSGVPPSELPAPSAGAQGVFCVAFENRVVNVRSPYLDTQARRAWLARLPDRPASTKPQIVASAPPAQQPEPVPTVLEGALLQQILDAGTSSGTGSEAVLPDTAAVEPVLASQVEQEPVPVSAMSAEPPTDEADKIRQLKRQGWSNNQIATELGGNRKKTLDKIRLVLGEQSATAS
ncbi:MAG TPA: FtsK/SpoIIIE domain-containing protein [Roseiflexaceae bacterium]|nr:FtsK/SpoIIIE domain-containing protein [Roseiflexaceae bacterium]